MTGTARLSGELAWQCRMLYREVVKFDHHGEEKRVTVEFGVVPVRLPDSPADAGTTDAGNGAENARSS